MSQRNGMLLRVTLAVLLSGQTPYGSIVGTVTDNTGAVMPGATMSLTRLGTNEKRSATTGGEGLYQFYNLVPGAYRLEAEARGFKRLVRQPIEVEVQKAVRVEVTLQVGDLTETVEVTAATPLLEPESSSLGAVVERRKVLDLPLNGRNPLSLAALVPGVVPQGGAALAAAATPNFHAWSNYQIGGAIANSSEMTWDGAPLNGGRMNTAKIVPTGDSVQEFRVQTNTLSADFGRTAGGIVNLTTKSGTNDLHASAYEFLRNRELNANPYFNNARGVRRPAFTQNQFGATAGGPVWLPGLYNGRDKMFFFASYEGFRQRRGNALLLTVPGEAERRGDFSQTLVPGGALRLIHDPITRSPLPGNAIPQSRVDPVAAQYVAQQLWAPPNRAGDGPARINNWAGNSPVSAGSDAFTGRGDRVVSQSQKLFGRYSFLRTSRGSNGAFGNSIIIQPGDEFVDKTNIHQALIEDIYTFSPATVVALRYSVLRLKFDRAPGSQGFDLTKLGFPASLRDQVGLPLRHVPNQFVIGMASLFGGGVVLHREDFHSAGGSLTRIAGRHTLRFGTELRWVRYNFGASNEPSGRFAYDGSFTAINPLAPAGTGVPFADFLFGYPNSGTALTPSLTAQQRFYRAFFVQDDFRVRRNLTLNLGLRYDQDGDWTERFDRQVIFLPGAPHPLAQPTGLPLRGNLAVVNTPDRPARTPVDTRLNQWAPRAGLAYQVTAHTVIRTGYGISWIPSTLDIPERSTFGLGQLPTQYVASTDGGRTPASRLSNPFPGGLLLPPRRDAVSALLHGADLQVGAAGFNPNGYSQQWNFNVQRQLGGSVLVEAAYAGLKGTNLPIRFQPLNQLPTELLAQGQALLTPVRNPFAGRITSGALAAAMIPQAQLLLPFPHYVGVFAQGATYGNSLYHSLQLKLDKRFRGGAGLLLAYTAAKLISDVDTQTAFLEPARIAFEFGAQNAYNRRAERSLSSFDTPQRFVASFTWDLPFGRGQRVGTGWRGPAGRIVSGWAVNGIYTLQRGFPVFLSTAQDLSRSYVLRGGVGHRPNSAGRSAELSGRAQDRLARWFDTSAFSQPPAFTFGNVSRTLPDVRIHGVNNFDFSAFKNTFLDGGEKVTLQFRAEFFNLFNRAQFGYPGQAFGTPQFGVVSSQVNEPRLVQFALKLIL